MINSKRPIPPGLDDTPHKASPRSNYKVLCLSDLNVYKMARTGNTVEELARYFNVHQTVIVDQYGEAFKLGKSDYKEMPQRTLYKLLDKLEAQLDEDDIRQNKNISQLLESIKLASRYNGREKESAPMSASDVAKALSNEELQVALQAALNKVQS